MEKFVKDVKEFYINYHDQISDKRYNSPYWLRRYTHREIHRRILQHVKSGQRVLDAGCGEGVLSCLLVAEGLKVVGSDLSKPNIERAQALASDREPRPYFLQADAESLPFPDESFDVVISSHVLEHLPSLDKGLRELYRVTRSLAVIAMPTCLNPACWVLLGGDNYWKLSCRSIMALPVGLTKTVGAFICHQEGPNEGYGGNRDIPHVWRFPWTMRRRIERIGFKIEVFEAGPLLIPYLAEYISVFRKFQLLLDRRRARPMWRNFGYGSMAVCSKRQLR